MSRAHLQDELVCLLNRPEAEVTTFLEDYFFAGHDYLPCYQNGLLLREKLMIAMADRAWQIFDVGDSEILASIKECLLTS